MTSAIEVPYLIVGAGPTGMTLARLLAHRGRQCLVVERRNGTQPNPSAHAVNARTLEIFRQAGFDMDALQAIAQSPSDAGHVNFVTRLNGRLIGRLPYERQDDACRDLTPTPLRNISQHRLEPLMAEELGRIPNVELRYGLEWVSAAHDADGVTSVLREVATGDEIEVRSNYLFAADGAGSRIRKSLGIEMVGPATLQDFVTIHFRANLRRYVADRPGVLHFVMDPEVSGTFIAHDIDRESVFMQSYKPSAQSLDDYTPERCTTLLRNAIGDPAADVQFVGVGAWHMTAQVAERAQVGRVFLVGDAAHRFPPTGGMGLNTGVADAHNLAWKIGAVDDGWAAPELLATYQTERLPVAQMNCQQSTTNAFKMVLLAGALGLRPGASSADLEAALDDPSRSDDIAAAVQAQAPHFNMLGLQLGYSYAEQAVDDDPGTFTPTGAVGERLPHVWLADGWSVLDLVEPTGLTLVSCGAHEEWAAALAGQPLSAPVRHERIDGTSPTITAWRAACGLGVNAALLVRPDQHIAWRSDEPPIDAGGLASEIDRIRTGRG